jgi:hypothetical protein
MGNWTIVIEGTGQHHNSHKDDADAMFEQIVAHLVKRGQTINHASITTSGRHVYEPSDEDGINDLGSD